MKTDFKHIKMVKIRDLPKTYVWEAQNISGGHSIGIIKWNRGQRQYCFFPGARTIYSIGCLEDICEFIRRLHQARAAGGS